MKGFIKFEHKMGPKFNAKYTQIKQPGLREIYSTANHHPYCFFLMQFCHNQIFDLHYPCLNLYFFAQASIAAPMPALPLVLFYKDFVMSNINEKPTLGRGGDNKIIEYLVAQSSTIP